MRVFITGASGFIGRALCERYAADGHEVRGCDLVGDQARQVVAGDVAQPGPWQDAAAGSELVIHTAATVSLRLERRDDIWRSNVLGTANAIDAAQRAGAQRFVHFSSVTVFGLEFPDGVDERYPVHNTFIPYPDSKIAAEQVVLLRSALASVGNRAGGADPPAAVRAAGPRPGDPLARIHRQPRRRGRARSGRSGRGRPGVHAV
jgi:nucleoside-diphosphate-sugar epimerase